MNKYNEQDINIVEYSENHIDGHFHAVKKSYMKTRKWFGFQKKDYKRKDSEEFIKVRIPKDEQECQYHRAIVDSKGNFLGSCSLKKCKKDKSIAKMNYWIVEGITGVGKIAATKLRDYGFSELGLKEIQLDIADCNKRSIGVALRIGAKPIADILIPAYDVESKYKGKIYSVKSDSEIA